MQRITIYGWVINHDPVQGNGSGSLVDLVYFVSDDQVSVSDIFSIIEKAGYKMIAKGVYDEDGHQKYIRDENGKNIKRLIEHDRIEVENWDSHLKIGTEQIPSQSFKDNLTPYDRYNYPYGGGM